MGKNGSSGLDPAKLSRRNFFAAGAGAIGTAVAGAIPLTASHAAAVTAWDLEADVIVVGSGAAAGCAAAKALDLGRSVIMLEKAAITGGTTAKSGGSYWIPNNSFLRGQGLDDPRDDAIGLMARMSYPQHYDPKDPRLGLAQDVYDMLAAYYDHGARAVDDLAKMGALQSMQYADKAGKPNFPDYFIPGNKVPLGRGLLVKKVNGKEGQLGGGIDMIAQLSSYIEKRGGRVFTRHRVTELMLNHKREVIGVKAQDGKGATVTVRAHRGVVFGSGGFTHNRAFADRYLMAPILGGCAVPSNEGDFIAIAGAAGAAMGNLGTAWWTEVVVEKTLDNRGAATLVAVPGDSVFFVNKYGRRVVDEKSIYHDRAQIHFVWDPQRFEYPNRILFMIWDQRTHDNSAGSFPIPQKGATSPDILSAPTLEGLADAIDARLKKLGGKIADFELDTSFKANLAQTKKRFNKFAKSRVDEDFHRGELPASAWFHRKLYLGGAYDPAAPNDMLYPLTDKGPFYATLVGAGALDTNAGPRINARSQVLDTQGQPIAGLYAAGNCIASPSGNASWGGGGTIGPALTFGYLAGENAAGEPPKTDTA